MKHIILKRGSVNIDLDTREIVLDLLGGEKLIGSIRSDFVPLGPMPEGLKSLTFELGEPDYSTIGPEIVLGPKPDPNASGGASTFKCPHCGHLIKAQKP